MMLRESSWGSREQVLKTAQQPSGGAAPTTATPSLQVEPVPAQAEVIQSVLDDVQGRAFVTNEEHSLSTSEVVTNDVGNGLYDKLGLDYRGDLNEALAGL